MVETPKLPWICHIHPKADILHSWDESHYVLNGLLAGTGTKGNHRYECAECGLELATPEAFLASRGKEGKKMSEQCTGPFSDAKDCPVHRKDIPSGDSEVTRLRTAIDKARRITSSDPDNIWCRQATIILNEAYTGDSQGS